MKCVATILHFLRTIISKCKQPDTNSNKLSKQHYFYVQTSQFRMSTQSNEQATNRTNSQKDIGLTLRDHFTKY